jgi:hypothetical protein
MTHCQGIGSLERMRADRLSGLQAKKWRRTTIRVPGVRVAEDLVDRQARQRSAPL